MLLSKIHQKTMQKQRGKITTVENTTFLTAFFNTLDLPGTAISHIKEKTGSLIGKLLDYHTWEKIFIQGGQAVAEYEKDGTEESGIRTVVFCKENMETLAKEMWETDAFFFEETLTQRIRSLLDNGCMDESNQKHCLNHFLQIILGDIRKICPDRITCSLLMETRDNTSEILDNQQRQFLQTRELERRLTDIGNKVQELGQEYQHSSSRQEIFSDTGKEAAHAAQWHLASLLNRDFSKEPEAQGATAAEAINRWRQEREEYPGWYIAPDKIYQKLWGRTKGYEYLLQEGLLPPEEAFALCYEFVWRYETGKLIYSAQLQRNVYTIWNQYGQSIAHGEGNRTEDWLYIGTALLREYREDGRDEEWRNALAALRPYQEETLYGKEILDVEEIKYAFSRFQIAKVRRLCGRCRLPKKAYSLRLQVIGLEAECGNTEEALKKARELKADLAEEIKSLGTPSEDGKERIYFNSLLGTLLHMESLLQQGAAVKDGNYENYQEQINEILNQAEHQKRYFDWEGLLVNMESALLKWHVKKHKKTHPFELERESHIICESDNVCEESYYLYRVVDAMGIPLVCNCVNLLGRLERVWLEALQEMTPQLALFLMLRGSKRETIQTCYNRCRMMWLNQETVTAQIRFLRDVLLENREEMAEITNSFDGGVCRELQSNLPEILIRCMSRCPEELQCEILSMAKTVMETQGLRLGQSMGSFMTGILRQVSERNKAKMLGDLLETAIVEHPETYGDAVDLFDFYFTKEHLEQYAPLYHIKQETIESLLSDNEDPLYQWRTKIARLLVIKRTGYLTEEQDQALTARIWSRLNKNNLPDLPNYYLWNFMKLNYGQTAIPMASVKACYLSSGMMALFEKEEGCEITMGSIRYLDELRAASRQLEKDFWTVEEIEQIYQDAIEYWQILREKMEWKRRDSHRRQEYRARAEAMFRTMAEVYETISGQLSDAMQNQVRRMLEESQELGIGGRDLKVLFLTREQKSDFARETADCFYSHEIHAVKDALQGAYTFMEKYPQAPESEYLLKEMLHILRSGKQPGLVLTIILLHNLLYTKNPVFTEDKIREADRLLISLEKKTKYEQNMESEKQIKEAALIRRVCADLVFEISQQEGGEDYPSVTHWKEACGENEFTDVRNELLF